MRERLPNNKNLREFNFGEWELKKSSEIAAKYPKLSKERIRQIENAALEKLKKRMGSDGHHAARHIELA